MKLLSILIITLDLSACGAINDKYDGLIVAEMQGSFGSYEPHSQRRGYKPNPISRKDLLDKIDTRLYNDYVPTQEAIAINRERINLRLKGW